jgi:hypothetical protein
LSVALENKVSGGALATRLGEDEVEGKWGTKRKVERPYPEAEAKVEQEEM